MNSQNKLGYKLTYHTKKKRNRKGNQEKPSHNTRMENETKWKI